MRLGCLPPFHDSRTETGLGHSLAVGKASEQHRKKNARYKCMLLLSQTSNGVLSNVDSPFFVFLGQCIPCTPNAVFYILPTHILGHCCYGVCHFWFRLSFQSNRSWYVPFFCLGLPLDKEIILMVNIRSLRQLPIGRYFMPNEDINSKWTGDVYERLKT